MHPTTSYCPEHLFQDDEVLDFIWTACRWAPSTINFLDSNVYFCTHYRRRIPNSPLVSEGASNSRQPISAQRTKRRPRSSVPCILLGPILLQAGKGWAGALPLPSRMSQGLHFGCIFLFGLENGINQFFLTPTWIGGTHFSSTLPRVVNCTDIGSRLISPSSWVATPHCSRQPNHGTSASAE